MSSLLSIAGILLGIVGYVMFLVVAFGEGFLWGILCFFFWPVQMLFLVTHWSDAKKPFFVQLAAAGLMLAGAMTSSR